MAAETSSAQRQIVPDELETSGVVRTTLSVETEDDRSVERLMALNNNAILEGLQLNMQEPWERSLQRLLEEQPNPASDSAMNTPKTNNGRSVVPELLLLSRTDSRDYALEIEGSMDDNSSVISRGTSPSRRLSEIYRKISTSNRQLGRKSLFDSLDDESEGNGTCRLSHKISTESLFLYFDQQTLEDRCEQDDYSERICSDDDPRSVVIHRASAVCENNSRESWVVDVEGSQQRPVSNLYLPMY
jgi:hypothetical protein